jgi:hypothetical protein
MEMKMFNKSKFVLVSLFVLGSASLAFGQSGEEMQSSQYQLNPNAPVPAYAQPGTQPLAFGEASAQMIEGRNVGVNRQNRSWHVVVSPIESFGGY